MFLRHLASLALIGSTLWINDAAALTACTAAQVTAQDSGCPASGTCTITKVFTVPDGCVLDFGARPVVLSPSCELDLASGSVVLRAASVVMNPAAFIDLRGTGSIAPGNRGGTLTIETTGDITLQKSGTTRARIDASGNALAGTVTLRAGGHIGIAGRIDANHLTAAASGGRINLEAIGNISTLAGSIVSATGGNQSIGGGGVLAVNAGADLSLGDEVDISGSSGGQATLAARGDVVITGLRANGNGDAGGGGVLAAIAGKSLRVAGPLTLRGSDYNVVEGGEGGLVTLDAAFGGLAIAASIFAEGAGPEADGGEITLAGLGSIDIQSGVTVSSRANGLYGAGGPINVDGELHLTSAGLLDASGGGSGGDIDIDVKGDVTISGRVDSRGRYNAGFGGSINIEAGSNGAGALNVAADIDVGGGDCDLEGCGDGGSVDLRGCNLTIAATGRVLGRAPGAGAFVQLVAREQLRVDGTVNATRTQASGLDGVVSLIFPSRKPPQLRIGGVSPAAYQTALPDCFAGSTGDCLAPCPNCGNGNIEYPEECDGGNAANCDGCSRFCRNEPCGPGVPCQSACDSLLGCAPPLAPCAATPTASPSTPSPTPTPSATALPGAPTNTVTPTAPPSATASTTATRTSTGTATRTPTATITRTPTITATASATPASTFDAVLVPPRPLTLKLRDDQDELSTLLVVRLTNGNLATPGSSTALIRITATDGDCPTGTLPGPIDADPAVPGAQDSVGLAAGRSVLVTLPVRIAAAAFLSQNKYSAARCTIAVAATALAVGNADPTPDNNLVTVEINVIDAHDVDPLLQHQTAIDSLPPLRVKVGAAKVQVTRKVRLRVANADSLDIAGHAITVVGSDGDCPDGTLGTVIFHRPNAMPINTTAVGNRRRARGKLPITIRPANFAGSSLKAPRRCTALLAAVGPSGDINDSNDVTALQIDVVVTR